MRRLTASALILLALTNFAPPSLCARAATRRQAAAPGATGNADLEAMLDAGLAPDIIVEKIAACGCAFDTSTAALLRLKAKGAGDAVLLAVVRAAVANRPAAPAPAEAAPATHARVVVPAGTAVEVESAHPISSAEVRAGDTINFRVVRAVEIAGATVIARGAPATARVVKAKKGRPFGKAGHLAFEMLDVEAADGGKIPLSFAESMRGQSKGGTVATAIAITAIFVFPVAPLWGFKRGKSAIIPPGKIFAASVRTATPVRVTPKR